MQHLQLWSVTFGRLDMPSSRCHLREPTFERRQIVLGEVLVQALEERYLNPRKENDRSTIRLSVFFAAVLLCVSRWRLSIEKNWV